jgi:hypothetical protein
VGQELRLLRLSCRLLGQLVAPPRAIGRTHIQGLPCRERRGLGKRFGYRPTGIWQRGERQRIRQRGDMPVQRVDELLGADLAVSLADSARSLLWELSVAEQRYRAVLEDGVAARSDRYLPTASARQ